VWGLKRPSNSNPIVEKEETYEHKIFVSHVGYAAGQRLCTVSPANPADRFAGT
jgi:hypothetical protein